MVKMLGRCYFLDKIKHYVNFSNWIWEIWERTQYEGKETERVTVVIINFKFDGGGGGGGSWKCPPNFIWEKNRKSKKNIIIIMHCVDIFFWAVVLKIFHVIMNLYGKTFYILNIQKTFFCMVKYNQN